jgi:hypothetical protein
LTGDFDCEISRLLCARSLTVASPQAALRAHGCLSIIDYPGFQSSAPPDIETYSKALNAGQYPLSVIAITEAVAAEYAHVFLSLFYAFVSLFPPCFFLFITARRRYVTGLYGNTMTGNPRAMEVACAVLDAITPRQALLVSMTMLKPVCSHMVPQRAFQHQRAWRRVSSCVFFSFPAPTKISRSRIKKNLNCLTYT